MVKNVPTRVNRTARTDTSSAINSVTAEISPNRIDNPAKTNESFSYSSSHRNVPEGIAADKSSELRCRDRVASHRELFDDSPPPAKRRSESCLRSKVDDDVDVGLQATGGERGPANRLAPHPYHAEDGRMTNTSTRGVRHRWLGAIGLLLLGACGTAMQGRGTTESGVESTSLSVASASVTPPPPDCPDDATFRADAGCVFEADGKPPSGNGAEMRPIPDGAVGSEDQQRHVGSFWMDARRVRVGEYRACVEAGACAAPEVSDECPWGKPDADVLPLKCVPFVQAEAYCAWAKRRLVTDDEWERALRNHAAFGLTELGGMVAQEWTSTYYCDERLSSCGHARVSRGGEKPEARGRMLGTSGGFGLAFRCAWSEKPPRPGAQPPAQVPLATSTPGRLQCNTTTCDLATEACCLNESQGLGYCIPKGEQNQCREADTRAQCDENEDCPGKQVCCPYWGCSGGCPPEQVCQDAPCEYGSEICQPGGQCRPGFTCETGWTGRQGYCAWQDVGAQCGGKRCSGATPLCCWDEKAGKGTCAASTCDSKELARFYCTGPKDCGGSTCAALQYLGAPDAPRVSYGCVPMSHLVNAVLCNTKKDCPRHPPTGTEPSACRHTADLPPGVKGCVYFTEPM